MALKDVDPGTTTQMSSSSLNTFLVAGRQQLRVKTRTGASMYFDYEDESGACAGFFQKWDHIYLGVALWSRSILTRLRFRLQLCLA